jgi:tetratricopeptide (TPR) repeat protein
MAELKSMDRVSGGDLEALRRSEQAGAQVMAARNALRKGDREKAKELLKQAFALIPGEASAIELLGDIYLEEGETEKAAQLFERALQQHPGHHGFEEKLAICHLDLAEMENDRLSKTLLLTEGDKGKIFERQPAKAVSLSLLMPGAGQFYNDEMEKGGAFLAGAVLTCIGWAWPLLGAMKWLPKGQRFDVGAALATLSGLPLAFFWVMVIMWMATYVVSCIDAGVTAAQWNKDRRRQVGL